VAFNTVARDANRCVCRVATHLPTFSDFVSSLLCIVWWDNCNSYLEGLGHDEYSEDHQHVGWEDN